MTDEHVPVVCDDCGAVVTLVRRPRNGLYVVCSCGHRSIDVDDCCADNNLFEAFTGKWADIDSDQLTGR
jgi:hypothetical protein